jgi:hypothetical protein
VPYTKDGPQEIPINAGQLACRIAHEVSEYAALKGMRFQTIAEVRGAIAAALNEFERRVAEPYEEIKLIDGGYDPYERLEDAVSRTSAEALIDRTKSYLERSGE